MNLQQLYFLKAVVDLESFTKAADSCHVTQSSLSHGIISLEKELGAQLIERTREKAYLTKYGKIYYPYILRSIEELENGKNALADATRPETGSITLAYMECLEDICAPIALDYISNKERKQVKFDFFPSTADVIRHTVITGNADLGISTHPIDKKLQSIKIGKQPLVLAVCGDQWFPGRNSVRLAELDGVPFITCRKELDMGQYISDILEEAECTPDTRHIGVYSSSLLKFVQGGHGVALVAKSSGKKTEGIRFLDIEDNVPERSIYLFWRESKYMTSAVSDFKDFFLEKIKQMNL